MNKGISAEIPNPLAQWQLEAIRWMEREYLAYLPAWQKGIRWGKLVHNIPGDNIEIKVNYTNNYGLFTTEAKYSSYINPQDNGYKNTTYCTMGFNAFLYFFMGYNTTDNVLTIQYGDKDYNKHPVSIFTQNNANKVCAMLETGEFNTKADPYGIHTHTVSEMRAAEYAQSGDLVLAAWKNPKGIGHVSTIIGGRLDKTGLLYEFAYPMVYNIGSKNGYMSLEEAFFDSKHKKDIKFYIVEKY